MRPRVEAATPKPTVRERLGGHEGPRALLKGPPIAIRCSCGERHSVDYGKICECTCGRRWNTAQIDATEYARLKNLQLRFRVVPVCLGLATSALALYFLLTGNTFSLFFLLPAALILWGMLLRPVQRRRYANALGELPKWDLRAEKSN